MVENFILLLCMLIIFGTHTYSLVSGHENVKKKAVHLLLGVWLLFFTALSLNYIYDKIHQNF